MGRRRRRTRHSDRARHEPQGETAVVEAKRPVKAEQRRREKYEQDRRRLVRRRSVVGALGFIPLLAAIFGVPFGPLDFMGVPPRDGWLLVWAALFGSFLGLTIRLVLERRKFERGTTNERPA